ncbi:MAG: ABC transporter ATP-binding protein [Bacteroidetes bacterium]|nr:ABC transporter ATP-binding protein [Bacteroidota bacterium]
MKQLAIKAENISKQYRLGEVGTGTISHDLNRFWHKLRGNEDPYLKIGESNDRSAKGSSDYVWSLKDINFEIEQGDAVGIIGRNGAGKSTLLKLLSKVTKPTTGSFKVNGRIASLLEVGTGFNPEMTGRENIYLNGAILGMRRSEITRKFDEIVDFSGVERYIDTPVKRYSSGMYVRLAFAVAAHLESEILIVDEVLAVGDAEFQKKCLGKMNDVSKGEGRTVLFVSHNMGAIQNLCNKGIVLDKGNSVFVGGQSEALDFYSNIFKNHADNFVNHFPFKNQLLISKIDCYSLGKKLNPVDEILLGGDLTIAVSFKVNKDIYDLSFALDILNLTGELICHITNEDDGFYMSKVQEGDVKSISITLKSINLSPNQYFINFWMGTGHLESIYKIENLLNFTVIQSNYTQRTRLIPSHSKVFIKSNWEKYE